MGYSFHCILKHIFSFIWKTSKKHFVCHTFIYKDTILNEFNISTIENAITSHYCHIYVKSLYKFRETINNHPSDFWIISPEINYCLDFFK